MSTEQSVGIRELKAKLSEYVRAVKRGSTIIVTDHGRRVARLVPEGVSFEDRLETLRHAGTVVWSGRQLGKTRPDVAARKGRTVADLVVENRE